MTLRKAVRTVTAGVRQTIRIRFGDVRRAAWDVPPAGVSLSVGDGAVTIDGSFPPGSWELYVLAADGIYRLAVESVGE